MKSHEDAVAVKRIHISFEIARVGLTYTVAAQRLHDSVDNLENSENVP